MLTPNQDIGQCLRKAIRTPDGFTTLLLSTIFIVVGLVPGGLAITGRIFGFALNPNLSPLHFLLVPIMLFVSYVWLNAFTKTSKVGVYINAIMLIVFAVLLFRGSVTFS
jgi:hypothetical protein